MNTAEKHLALFTRLFDLTKAGQLDWQETFNKNVFSVSFPNYSLDITSEWNQESDAPDVLLTVRNSGGAVVEVIRDTAAAEALPAEKQSSFYTMAMQLYNTARRKAMGAEEALDAILGELGGKGGALS